MKKIFLIIFMFILIFLIYYLNLDQKVYVLSIGDHFIVESDYHKDIDNYLGKKLEKSVIYSNNGDYRIIDLINDIKDNKKFTYKNNQYTINNTLIKADIIFISIGMNDLRYNKNNNNYDYVDEVISDLDILLKLIRKYSKEKIYIFNYYNFDNDFNNYINERLKKIADRYNIGVICLDSYDNISKTIKKSLKEFY